MPDDKRIAQRQCAFLTLEERGDWVIDDEVAIPALVESGWEVSVLPWTRSGIDWRSHDLVIVRSTWDYWNAPKEFFRVLESIDRQTLLANPLALMRWNLSKTYLRDLEKAGVPIVPSCFVDALGQEDLTRAQSKYAGSGWVLKPQLGASGIDAFLFQGESCAFDEALERLEGRAVIIQPFRRSVVEEGEYSLFYFSGQFSHAICKRPAPGEFRSQEERGATIENISLAAEFHQAGRNAIKALPLKALYARVDLIRNNDDELELMELELIEPSLYFRTCEAAPGAFARAMNDWVGPNQRQ